jgi:hypothetical protein
MKSGPGSGPGTASRYAVNSFVSSSILDLTLI